MKQFEFENMMIKKKLAVAIVFTLFFVASTQSEAQTIFRGNPGSTDGNGNLNVGSNINIIINNTGDDGDRTPIVTGTVGSVQITPSDFAINTTAAGIASAGNVNALAGTPLLDTDTVTLTFEFAEVTGDLRFNGIEFGLSPSGTDFRPSDNLMFRLVANDGIAGLSVNNAVGASTTDAGFGIDEDSLYDGFKMVLTANAAGWSFVFTDVVTSSGSPIPGATTASFSGGYASSDFLSLFSTGHMYTTLQGEGGPGAFNGGVAALLSEFSIAINEPTSGLVGDFDDDGDVDCDDANAYSGNLGMAATGVLEDLDLNDDSMVALNDAQQHVQNHVVTSNGVAGTFLGDIDCDGRVNVLGDAFVLVRNLGGTGLVYTEGDLNFDGIVNVLGDAFVLVSNLGMNNQ